jgi:class 3 adenylate cyclase
MFDRVSNVKERVEQYVRGLEPSVRADRGYFEWAARMFPLNCTPQTWVTYLRLRRDTDLTSILPFLQAPTLILSRPGRVSVGGVTDAGRSSRFVAGQIPGSKLVELPGEDANPWVGESDAVVDAIEEFLIGAPAMREPTRALTTVLFTDIVDSTKTAASMGDAHWRELVAAHHERARAAFATHRGREIDAAGDGFLATFDGPARAVECALEICRTVRDLDLEVRTGCHTGEVERTPDGVRGIAVHIGARVAALAGPGEVLVSQTVRDLTAGSGLVFDDAGEHELKGVPERWKLYRVAHD